LATVDLIVSRIQIDNDPLRRGGMCLQRRNQWIVTQMIVII
jgi:hypothetical protein